MNIDREKAEFLDKTIEDWEKDQLISSEQAQKLKGTYQIKSFDWRKLAQYSIYIALACGVFSLGSILIDKKILELLERLYNTPNYIISLLSAAIAVYTLNLGYKRRISKPQEQFSNEALLFIGVLFIANSLAYFGKSISTGSDHYSLIFLLAVPVYAFLGFRFQSRLIWAFALFSLGAWFGTETSYISRGNFYFLGMNYPLRFVFFGLILTATAWLLKKRPNLSAFFETTYFIGLVYTFTAFWLLSIFGNYASIDQWYKINQIELFGWAILSVSFCLLMLFLGFKFKNELAREFGVTFLLINLYSRFFEYFWDSWHKAIFFLVLGASFWLIGRKAEKIWNLEFLKEKV